MLASRRWLGGTLMAMALAISGCSGRGSDRWTEQRPPVYKASGIVLLDGEPLAEAEVVLHSSDKAISATGRTDQAGKFKLTTFDEGDGFIEGTHAVTVSKRVWIAKPTRYDTPSEPQKAYFPEEQLPKRYTTTDTSQLTATIEKRGKNDLKIEVSSK
jgi:hypothetical protein